MVQNFYTSCDVCGCTIRLRYQVSDVICPIKFHCPDCKTEISGSLQTIWHTGKEKIEPIPWHYDLKLKNAGEAKVEFCKYVLEISPDLSTNKIMPDSNDLSKYIPTPFIRQSFIPNEMKNQNTRYYNFLEVWGKEWDSLKIKIDLCHNEKYDVLLTRISNQYSDFPDDINCIMSVHQELIKFCYKILPKNTLKEYTKLENKVNKIVMKKSELYDEFSKLYNIDYTKQIERKSLQLIKTFLNIYPKFLPVFNTLRVDDYKDLGVSTLTFEDIKSFYQDSYELILYNIPRIVALNNIYHRNDINSFITGNYDFESKINSYRSKVNLYKELMGKHDDFSWLISNDIKNNIRNSIGHFNYEENLAEQTVLFIDDHMGKEKKKIKSLIEIARDCVYMFYTLMNLLELNYALLKVQATENSKV